MPKGWKPPERKVKHSDRVPAPQRAAVLPPDAVNTAARVESLNKTLKQTLLVSSATVDELGALAERLRLQDLGSHQVKGRREPVQVYTVAGRKRADG